jgi:hypothetical protein
MRIPLLHKHTFHMMNMVGISAYLTTFRPYYSPNPGSHQHGRQITTLDDILVHGEFSTNTLISNDKPRQDRDYRMTRTTNPRTKDELNWAYNELG